MQTNIIAISIKSQMKNLCLQRLLRSRIHVKHLPIFVAATGACRMGRKVAVEALKRAGDEESRDLLLVESHPGSRIGRLKDGR